MNKIQGPADLYEAMVTMRNTENVNAMPFRKSQAKEAGIDWKFVEESAKLLGLQLVRSGTGFLIVK